MRVTEVIKQSQAQMRNINIQVPANASPMVVGLIQQLANHLSAHPQPLSYEELQQRISAAHWDKMRRLAIIYQNRRIWNAGNLVNKQNKRDAKRYGEPEIPGVSMDNWLTPRGNINWKSITS